MSQTSSQLAITNGMPTRKQNTIDYLQKGKQQKESVRDFILNARNILMAQISINDKTEETELLKEYIIMEKERLDANKKTFQEDKDKYEKYKMDLQNKSQITEQSRVAANRQDETLLAEINALQKEDNSHTSNQHKTDEELEICKAHKKFLDLLAIGAGLKKPRPQKKKGGNDGFTEGSATPAPNSRLSRGKNEGRSTTFMTQPPAAV